MKSLITLSLALSFAPHVLQANEWPSWRGPSGGGVLPDTAVYPTQWSGSENVYFDFRFDLPGNSSSIVLGDLLFLTTAEDEGHERSLRCFRISPMFDYLWERTVEVEQDEITHRTNPWSAASPASNGKNVCAWHGKGLSDLCYTNPVVGDGKVVYMAGYGGTAIGMVLPDADTTANIGGDSTETHRIWQTGGKDGQKKFNPQRIGSAQIIGEHLYILNELGAAECIEVATGRSLWKERLGRKSWSSMNYVGGKLYVNDQGGTTYVIEPDPTAMKLIATNAIDGNHMTNSTLAFANGRIFLRTHSRLMGFYQPQLLLAYAMISFTTRP